MKHLRILSKIHNNQKPSMRGRKYITPNDLSAEEMKHLLMTALELKTSETKPLYIKSLAGKSITFLLDSPCLRLQSCIYSTSNLLNMTLNTIITSEWETMLYPQDIGRLLSNSSDIIFCKAHRQKKLESFAEGSIVPVVNVSSCRFVLLHHLSNLLTLQQHFGNLEGLIIAWIGHPCPLLNTYLTIVPTLNMQIRFLCRCGGPVSPSDLNYVLSKGDEFTQKVKECNNIKEAIEGAHVIATTDHSETNLKLTLADLTKYAHKDWVFFHTLPRTFHEVEDEVFNSDRNLLWVSNMNNKWICAAIISRFLDCEESNVNLNSCGG
ncbi:ornithine carbamoyltransferase, mitochondrial-like [Anoplophora glabripennis]|uniref:ornithine carbamoyltransferase, mitochondrial-like n=1 Tax=Anoplophora glabripennis TaxID=217634 RepID=UPI000874BD87|nr:ornithine carbamoyltransferase, mitochondrial-like [Anoplophora glabripennis]